MISDMLYCTWSVMQSDWRYHRYTLLDEISDTHCWTRSVIHSAERDQRYINTDEIILHSAGRDQWNTLLDEINDTLWWTRSLIHCSVVDEIIDTLCWTRSAMHSAELDQRYTMPDETIFTLCWTISVWHCISRWSVRHYTYIYNRIPESMHLFE